MARAEPDDSAAERLLLEEVQWAARWQWPSGPYMPVFRLARELGLPLVALNVDDASLDRVRPALACAPAPAPRVTPPAPRAGGARCARAGSRG